jgi:hypothetical protein
MKAGESLATRGHHHGRRGGYACLAGSASSRPGRRGIRRQAAGLAVAVALGLALLSSCSTDSVTSRPPAVSAWQRVLDRIGPDGQVSKSTALAAFVLAIGPLPGVPRPRGPAQQIPDGSGAVRWLLDYYSRLTPGQRSAAQRLLHIGAPATLTSLVDGRTAGQAARGGPRPGTAQDLALERWAAEQISDRLHVELTIAVQIFENRVQVYPGGQDADAYTYALAANGQWNGPGPVAKCVIFLNPSAHQGGDTSPHFRAVMVHEVFHCFEAQLAPSSVSFYRPGGSWLLEGAAAWAESDLVAPDAKASDWWQAYFDTPGKPLFSRSYDAIGFFGHLSWGAGGSAWNVLPAMLRTASNTAAYQAAGIGQPFLNSEASVFFEKRDLGTVWYQHGDQGDATGVAAVNVPAPIVPVREVSVAQGQDVTFTAAPYADTITRLRLLAPATRVTVIRGHVRLRNADGSFEKIDPTTELCTAASGDCRGCNGTSSPDLLDFGTAGYLALTGGPGGTIFKVSGLSQKDLCQGPPPPLTSCVYLPDFGVLVSSSYTRDDGFTTLSCQYSTQATGGIPIGFVLIETYDRPSAAEAAWKRGGISGSPQPGFTVPVLASLADCPDCQRHEFALDGYRIDEIAESQTPGLNTLPTLEATNYWMTRLLAAP